MGRLFAIVQVLVLACAVPRLYARKITTAEADTAVQSLVSFIPELAGRSTGRGTSCRAVYSGRSLLAYGAPLTSSGFVVLAADTRIAPVLGFSPQSSLRLDSVPQNGLLAWIRAEIPARLARLASDDGGAERDGNTTPSPAEAAWTALLAGEPLPTTNTDRSRATIGPLLTTSWGQDYDSRYSNDNTRSATYNYYTPPYGTQGTPSPDNYPTVCSNSAQSESSTT